ncbi:hypothetical protein DFH09DRAFT_1338803 [Mycena vulgaris]|nr:hypothetical protein DFH09DRAFT_1338803 [Mycena vulgaris]
MVLANLHLFSPVLFFSHAATPALLAALPRVDPYLMALHLSKFIYDNVLHSFYQTLPPNEFLTLAIISDMCCTHFDAFAGRCFKVRVPGHPTDLLAKLPWELLYPLMRDMAVVDRIRLSQTSRRNHELCRAILHYSVSDVMAGFGLRYTGVRLMQTCTGCVVSGSLLPAVLHNGTPFTVNDIDFYCPVGQGWRTVAYLRNTGGYTDEAVPHDYSAIPGLGRIWCLGLCSHKINVIESKSACARDAVLHHHSTPVMGSLCAYKGWMAYPQLSAARLALATKHTMRVDRTPESLDCLRQIVHKYMDRGFRFVFDYARQHDCGVHPSCPVTLRTTVDSGCLNMYLPTSPFTAPIASHESSWTMRGSGCRHGGVTHTLTPAVLPASSYEGVYNRSSFPFIAYYIS